MQALVPVWHCQELVRGTLQLQWARGDLRSEGLIYPKLVLVAQTRRVYKNFNALRVAFILLLRYRVGEFLWGIPDFKCRSERCERSKASNQMKRTFPMRNHLRVARLIFCLLTLCLMSSAVTLAQEETAATLNVQVTDSTGAVIPNATVVITNDATGQSRSVQTNDEGYLSVSPLTPGNYTVTVEQASFKKYVENAVVLSAKDRRLITVVLEAGNVNEVVTVTSEQNVVQDSPTGQTLISGEQVLEIPLQNRDFTKLLELAPGVSSSLDDETGFGLANRFDVSINGMRRNGVNVFVDGVSNTDVGSNITLLSTPTIDSIAEFKVLTSNYTAEVGRSGGGTVTLVTKSGGNAFHGSIYEFARN